MPPRPCALSVALLALSTSVVAAPSAENRFTHIRCLDKHALGLLRAAASESPTVYHLAMHVEGSDVVAFVRLALLETGLAGKTQMISWAGGVRYVMVTIDPRHTTIDLVGALGHELRHVLEIAEAPGVKDAQALGELLERIGWRSGSGRWETQGAVDAGRVAAREAADRPAHVTDLARARSREAHSQ